MSIPQQTRPGARYWPVPVARAVPALAAAAVITFSEDHSAALGLIVFGVFGVLTGLIVGLLSWRRMPRGTSRSLSVSQAAISVLAGLLAVMLHTGGLGFFLYLVSVWAALTGFLELYAGFRIRPANAGSRDWLIAGSGTAVLAVVFLLIEPDPILAVGIFGAYGVILGVYLVIAGLSLKWTPTESAEPSQGAASRGAETETRITQ